MAKSLEIRPEEDLSGIPVGLLSILDRLEQVVLGLAQDVDVLKRIVVQNIGLRMDGALWQGVKGDYDMILNLSGETLALAQVLIRKELTTEDELREIRRVEFDEPLQRKMEAERAKFQEELEEARRKAAAEQSGLVLATPHQTSQLAR